MASNSWANLPEHIIASILSYFNHIERCTLALVCKTWFDAFKSPSLWHAFRFDFLVPKEYRFKSFLKQHGHHLRAVTIRCDQEEKLNRNNACKLIHDFRYLPKRRIDSLTVQFTGENPFFYDGKEFIQSLQEFFGPSPEDEKVEKCHVISRLKRVDLSRLSVTFNNDLFLCLAEHNSDTLEYLNIQNASLVCKVTTGCILELVQKCRKLKYLATHYVNIADITLLTFTEEGRTPLQHLSVLCRREEKYRNDIESKTWETIAKKLPDLRVTLYFDYSCPMFKVDDILKPEIPVSCLKLLIQARVVQHVYFATRFYNKTLEKVAISTTNSPELENALLHLTSACPKLSVLHVFQCFISSQTREEILKIRPGLKNFTLNER